MKKTFFLALGIALASSLSSQEANLKLHYDFRPGASPDSVYDRSGSGYHGRLVNNVQLQELGDYSIIATGSTPGYVQISPDAGELIATLTDFSVATYLYVDPGQTITANGNFIWTFANSDDIAGDANGAMFFTAKETRYAISTTNWRNERQLSMQSPATKGSWSHITYVQQGTTARIYINGVEAKSGELTLLPQSLGETQFNFLFKSPYSSDALLLNSRLADFRLYNTVLTTTQIVDLAKNRVALDNLLIEAEIDAAIAQLDLGDLTAVRHNISLPATVGSAINVSWQSSNTAVFSNTGVVTRPPAGAAAVELTLTGTFSRSSVSRQQNYQVTVQPDYTAAESVAADAAALALEGRLMQLRSPLSLPVVGAEGTTISWSPDQPQYLSSTGAIVSRPAHGMGAQKVILTATISKADQSTTRDFEVWVAEDEGFVGYLFSYFTGNHITQEQIRFAISDDGYNYRAMNRDEPIIASADISLTGGVRDPHILRGEDGKFYMVVTDMVSANGWSSNRGMVLLKSDNLVDWTSSTVHIPTAFPAEFGNVDRVWAPQTIYDPEVGKYMVYFSMKKGSGDYDKIYYAYANADFTALETVPKQLFYNPSQTAAIDGDIVFWDGQYHLFFKTEGTGNGIKKAVSDSLTGGWVVLDKYLQQTSAGVEGSCVFRLYNTDNWILMYDVYTAGYYQFTQSTDLQNFSLISDAISMDFHPRHGTVIPLTAQEMMAVRNRWDETVDVSTVQSAPLEFTTEGCVVRINASALSPDGTLRISDISGRLLHTATDLHDGFTYEFPQSGVYILHYFESGQGVRVSKILIP